MTVILPRTLDKTNNNTASKLRSATKNDKKFFSHKGLNNNSVAINCKTDSKDVLSDGGNNDSLVSWFEDGIGNNNDLFLDDKELDTLKGVVLTKNFANTTNNNKTNNTTTNTCVNETCCQTVQTMTTK